MYIVFISATISIHPFSKGSNFLKESENLFKKTKRKEKKNNTFHFRNLKRAKKQKKKKKKRNCILCFNKNREAFLFFLIYKPLDAFHITQRLINFIYSVCYVRWARGCPRQHICSKYLKNR